MTVSKRTRFEVLKRDNHTCRYCGATADDGPLTVDHVVPVALGGSDKHDNLVAACKDCNAGKSSTSPDAEMVSNVSADAFRHAELLLGAYAVIAEKIGERNEYVDDWAALWSDTLPPGWRNSLGRWFEMGVPLAIVVDAAETAMHRDRNFRGTDRFSYMCGIVWSQVDRATEAVAAKRQIEGSFLTQEQLLEHDLELWTRGWNGGYEQALRNSAKVDHLSVMVDKIDYAAVGGWPR